MWLWVKNTLTLTPFDSLHAEAFYFHCTRTGHERVRTDIQKNSFQNHHLEMMIVTRRAVQFLSRSGQVKGNCLHEFSVVDPTIAIQITLADSLVDLVVVQYLPYRPRM